MSLARRVKRRVLPATPAVRKLPFGLARGLKMEIDFSYQTRLYLGLYETELNRHLRRLCRPGYNAFDVGGQFGYDALVIAKLTGGLVVSVDSDPHAIARMQANFAANPTLAPRLSAHNATVGATSLTADTTSLDDLAANTFMPDLVKIDIEGAEVEALRGAGRILGERRPAFLIEVHSVVAENECSDLLRRAGYRPALVDQRRFFADHRPIDHNRWLVADALTAAQTSVG